MQVCGRGFWSRRAAYGRRVPAQVGRTKVALRARTVFYQPSEKNQCLSWHNGGPIEGPLYYIIARMFERFQLFSAIWSRDVETPRREMLQKFHTYFTVKRLRAEELSLVQFIIRIRIFIEHT